MNQEQKNKSSLYLRLIPAVFLFVLLDAQAQPASITSPTADIPIAAWTLSEDHLEESSVFVSFHSSASGETGQQDAAQDHSLITLFYNQQVLTKEKVLHFTYLNYKAGLSNITTIGRSIIFEASELPTA